MLRKLIDSEVSRLGGQSQGGAGAVEVVRDGLDKDHTGKTGSAIISHRREIRATVSV